MKPLADHAVPPADALWMATNPALGEPIAVVVGNFPSEINEPDLISATICHDDMAVAGMREDEDMWTWYVTIDGDGVAGGEGEDRVVIPNIEDLTEPPVVGQMYMVPCVLALGQYWPVTGPRHEDAEFIGFDKEHRHYDLRFLTARQMDEVCRRGGHANVFDILAGNQNSSDSEAHGFVLTTDEGFERRPLVCQREQPRYEIRGGADWVPKLTDHLESARVKCGKCPHRGLPLSSLPRESGTDIVTCPGHGLKWDLKTGQIVKGAACAQ